MFAFGLFDRARRRLLLARDRVGKKPLYYHDDGQRIAFASELKALMLDPSVPRNIDERALADYLTFQYVPSPASIWRGVRKLPPGHFLVCDERGARIERYWELPSGPPITISEREAKERLTPLLADAVRVRLMSDVPLGAFLSGGIDSSVVVAFMAQAMSQPVRTFSIGFTDQDHSELEHARVVARHLGTEHHELIVEPHAVDLLPRLVWHLDEPFADASAIPTSYVSEMARLDVTVALSGDGGDEAFGGYVTYPWAREYQKLDALPAWLRKGLAAPARWLPPDHGLGRKLHRLPQSIADRHLEAMAFFPPRDLASLLAPELRGRLGGHDPLAAPRAHHARLARELGDLPALLALDATTYMIDDVLVKVDRASMMHSLEVRCPLLDHQVLEFVSRLPFELKLRGNTTKWLLREIGRDLLPPAILARGKQGFGVPLVRWFGGQFGTLARETLLDSRARARGWFVPGAVEALLSGLTGDASRDERRAYQVWSLVCLELWAQTWLDRPRESLAAPLAPARSVAA